MQFDQGLAGYVLFSLVICSLFRALQVLFCPALWYAVCSEPCRFCSVQPCGMQFDQGLAGYVLSSLVVCSLIGPCRLCSVQPCGMQFDRALQVMFCPAL